MFPRSPKPVSSAPCGKKSSQPPCHPAVLYIRQPSPCSTRCIKAVTRSWSRAAVGWAACWSACACTAGRAPGWGSKGAEGTSGCVRACQSSQQPCEMGLCCTFIAACVYQHTTCVYQHTTCVLVRLWTSGFRPQCNTGYIAGLPSRTMHCRTEALSISIVLHGKTTRLSC